MNGYAENAIRPFVIGRKGWLFASPPQGAHASATHYSLIETAKANNVEPFAYYAWLLKKLPYLDAEADDDLGNKRLNLLNRLGSGSGSAQAQ